MLCMLCVFGLRQKHHCRHCGGIFCGRCSAHSACLPSLGYSKRVRICDPCYQTLLLDARSGGSPEHLQRLRVELRQAVARDAGFGAAAAAAKREAQVRVKREYLIGCRLDCCLLLHTTVCCSVFGHWLL